MKWLTELEYYNIYFNLYILDTNDAIILSNTTDNNQLICILDGFMQTLKIFTNGERICTQLLYKNNAINTMHFHLNSKPTYHYKAIAITKTVIITIPIKKLKKKANKAFKIINNFKVLQQNYDIIHILSHKSVKRRIIQLLLILIKHFGQILDHYITIPFYISHYTIANITGSQRITINRIMSSFKQSQIIHYDNQKLIIYSILQLIQI